MIRLDFAANAACVHEIEIAFSIYPLLFVPEPLVGTNCESKNLTARASRNCRSMLGAVWSGRFVHLIGGAIRSARTGSDNPWTRFIEKGARNG